MILQCQNQRTESLLQNPYQLRCGHDSSPLEHSSSSLVVSDVFKKSTPKCNLYVAKCHNGQVQGTLKAGSKYYFSFPSQWV